jgi:hypothetical protein
VCLSAKLSGSMGGLGPLVLVTKVSNQISLIDPATLRCAKSHCAVPRCAKPSCGSRCLHPISHCALRLPHVASQGR